jgi:hypothetical protein
MTFDLLNDRRSGEFYEKNWHSVFRVGEQTRKKARTHHKKKYCVLDDDAGP